MHSYDRTYNLCISHGALVPGGDGERDGWTESRYVDTLDEVREIAAKRGQTVLFVDKGYGDWRDTGVEGITEVVRRTTGSVPRHHWDPTYSTHKRHRKA